MRMLRSSSGYMKIRRADTQLTGVLLAWAVLLTGFGGARAGMPINQALNMSAKVSPVCRQALHAIPPLDHGLEEANFASGDMVTGFRMLAKKVMTSHNLLGIIGGVSVADMGNYDNCMAIRSNVEKYHFCDIHLTDDKPLIRWGVCIPQACSGQDVLDAVVPPIAQGDMRYICGDGAPTNRPALRALSAFVLLMAALITIATGMDVMRRWQAYVASDKLHDTRREEVGTQLFSESKRHSDDNGSTDSSGPSDSSTASQASQTPSHPDPPTRATAARSLFLRTFSLYENVGALMKPRTGSFRCLDGLRTLAMLHIILGHAFFIPLGGGYTNAGAYALDDRTHVQNYVIRSALLSVSFFFLLSGFLGVEAICKHLSAVSHRVGTRTSNKRFLMSYPMIVAMRWLRLVPTYAFVMALYLIAGPLMTDGPSTHLYIGADLRNCATKWWQNLLFISNLKSDWLLDICIPTSWYLDVDFQLWLVAPFFVLVAWNHEFLGYALGAGIIMASMIYTGWLVNAEHLTINMFNRGDEFNKYIGKVYIQPQSRLPGFFIGCLLGLAWFYHGRRLERAVRDMRKTNILRWVLAAVLASGVLLAIPTFWPKGVVTARGEIWPSWKMAIYVALAEPMWVSGIAIIATLGILGLAGPVGTFLELPIFSITSRLSFGAYLFHPALLNLYTSNMISPYRYSDLEHYSLTFGIACLSYGLAALAFILVERPFAELSKAAMMGMSGTRPANAEAKAQEFKLEAKDVGAVGPMSKELSQGAPLERTADVEAGVVASTTIQLHGERNGVAQ